MTRLRHPSLAAALLLLFGGACQQDAPIPPPQAGYSRVTPWTALRPDVAVAQTTDGATTISASAASGYQAEHLVTTQGADALVLRFDVGVSGGPGFLGVLAGDRSRWLHNETLAADTATANTVRIADPGDNVLLVFQTLDDAATPTIFTIYDVQYALE